MPTALGGTTVAIFPRDPQFAEKVGRILDLYQGIRDGATLAPTEFLISADEKTSN